MKKLIINSNYQQDHLKYPQNNTTHPQDRNILMSMIDILRIGMFYSDEHHHPQNRNFKMLWASLRTKQLINSNLFNRLRLLYITIFKVGIIFYERSFQPSLPVSLLTLLMLTIKIPGVLTINCLR